MHSPLEKKMVRTMVFVRGDGQRQIAIRCADINRVISSFYNCAKGEGAYKLAKRISDSYAGISAQKVQEWLNRNEGHYRLRPQFRQNAPLRSIDSTQPMGRNQIDLVDFSSMPSKGYDRLTYKYVLAILDVFSRYLVLRPLPAKESALVAKELQNVYGLIGIPNIINCDRGTEFRGCVSDFCSENNIQMIRSSPYTPRTQGKIERSHATWKRKMMSDINRAKKNGTEYSWVKNLQRYQDIYNSGAHKSLGKLSPTEVFFGRKLNIFRKEIPVVHVDLESNNTDDADNSVASAAESEYGQGVEMSDINDSEGNESSSDDNSEKLRKFLDRFGSVKKSAHDHGKRASERMKSYQSRRKPPTP